MVRFVGRKQVSMPDRCLITQLLVPASADLFSDKRSWERIDIFHT
jgi:hypothetical protein